MIRSKPATTKEISSQGQPTNKRTALKTTDEGMSRVASQPKAILSKSKAKSPVKKKTVKKTKKSPKVKRKKKSPKKST
jgi:hypothetical protein